MVPNPIFEWMIWGYHYFWKHPYPKLDGLKFGRCISGFKHGAILHIHFVKISGGGEYLLGFKKRLTMNDSKQLVFVFRWFPFQPPMANCLIDTSKKHQFCWWIFLVIISSHLFFQKRHIPVIEEFSWSKPWDSSLTFQSWRHFGQPPRRMSMACNDWHPWSWGPSTRKVLEINRCFQK